MDVLRQCGQDRAKVEQLVLDAKQDGAQHRQTRLLGRKLIEGGPRSTQEGVEFVHGSVGRDSRAVLSYSLPADQTSFSLVAGAGIDAVDGQARLVEWFAHGYCTFEMLHFNPAT